MNDPIADAIAQAVYAKLQPLIARNQASDLQCLTVDEVAKLLGVDPKTVRRYLDQGVLKAIRLSEGAVRVRRVDVERYLRQCTDT